MAFKVIEGAGIIQSAEEAEFEALYGAGGTEPKTRQYRRGEEVTGSVIKVSGDVAFINLGGKAEGILELAEGEGDTLTAGQQITAMVTGNDGAVRLRRGLTGKGARDTEALSQAHQLGMPVDGKIASRNKGGFEVMIGSTRGFLPLGQLALEQIPEADLDSWIGTNHAFRIIEFDASGRRLVLSRAALLRAERDKKAEALWAELAVGQVRKGVVRSVQDYGCFVDIGGVDGLVHVAEMDWTRVTKPSDLVKSGQEVVVVILGIETTPKKRVSLSMKAAGQDPWKALAARVGDTLEGEVTRLEKFGAFVEIAHGVEGLVHVSEMTHERRVRHPSDVVKPGDRIRVTVLDIDLSARKLSLSMKALEGDPWANAATDYPPGARVSGTVERVAPFGVFIRVGPAITALLPGSETGLNTAEVLRRFQIGTVIEASVLAVDPESRRMSLSMKAAGEREERENIAAYRARQPEAPKGSFGTFAELLQGKSGSKR